jgi:hypothetical protein
MVALVLIVLAAFPVVLYAQSPTFTGLPPLGSAQPGSIYWLLEDTRLLVTTDEEVRLYDSDDLSSPLVVIGNMSGTVITNPGSTLFFASNRLWDASTGALIHDFRDSDISNVVFPVRDVVSISHRNGTTRLWRVLSETATQVAEFNADLPVTAVSFSADGARVAGMASLPKDDPEVIQPSVAYLWDANTGELIRRQAFDAEPELFAITTMDFTADGNYLYFEVTPAWNIFPATVIWDAGDGHSVAHFDDYRPISSNNGSLLLLTRQSADEESPIVQVWEGEILGALSLPPSDLSQYVAYLMASRSGEVVVFSTPSGIYSITPDMLRLRKFAHLIAATPEREDRTIYSLAPVALSADGRQLALTFEVDVACGNCENPTWIYIHVLDTQTGTHRASFDGQSEGRFNPTGERFASSSFVGQFRSNATTLWDIGSGERLVSSALADITVVNEAATAIATWRGGRITIIRPGKTEQSIEVIPNYKTSVSLDSLQWNVEAPEENIGVRILAKTTGVVAYEDLYAGELLHIEFSPLENYAFVALDDPWSLFPVDVVVDLISGDASPVPSFSASTYIHFMDELVFSPEDDMIAVRYGSSIAIFTAEEMSGRGEATPRVVIDLSSDGTSVQRPMFAPDGSLWVTGQKQLNQRAPFNVVYVKWTYLIELNALLAQAKDAPVCATITDSPSELPYFCTEAIKIEPILFDDTAMPLAFSTNETWWVSWNIRDNTVSLRATDTNDIIASFSAASPAFSPDSQLLAVRAGNSIAIYTVVSLASGDKKPLAVLEVPENIGAPRFSADETVLYARSGGRIHRWRIENDS